MWSILLTGTLIFLARIVDVSLGTLRTISIVRGRTGAAFFLGFFEVAVWIFVLGAVIEQVSAQPVLGLFYALGFSTGNVVGIMVERKLAWGHTSLRIFSPAHGPQLAAALREQGFRVTTFQGEGRSGPLLELFLVCSRNKCPAVLKVVRAIDENVFYTMESPGHVSQVMDAGGAAPTGWRAILKKK